MILWQLLNLLVTHADLDGGNCVHDAHLGLNTYQCGRCNARRTLRLMQSDYRSRAARQAFASGYTYEGYAEYLDQSAQEHYEYFMARGDAETAREMFTRSLGESLMGNEGD